MSQARRVRRLSALLLLGLAACNQASAPPPAPPKATTPAEDQDAFFPGRPQPRIAELDRRIASPTWGGARPPAPVPEPATLMLVGAGLVGTAVLRRRRKTLAPVRATPAPVQPPR